MGKRRKSRRSRELSKNSPYSQPTGVKHDSHFKVDGSSRTRRRKRQKMRVRQLFEKGIGIVPDERLSMSMSCLNISVTDELQTKDTNGIEDDVIATEFNSTKDTIVIDELNSTDDVIIIESNAANDVIVIDDSRDIHDVSIVDESSDMVVIDTLNSTSDFIVIDELNSTNDVSIIDDPASTGQQLEGNSKGHLTNLPTNLVVLDETNPEEKSNTEKENLTLTNEICNKQVSPVEVREVVVNKDGPNHLITVKRKEIVCNTKHKNPKDDLEKPTTQETTTKRGEHKKVQPLSDATNTQRVREQFPKNTLFHEMLKTAQNQNTKNNNEYACMLEEYKSWRANTKSRAKNNQKKSEKDQAADMQLKDLNASHLENLKSSLERELEAVEKQYTLRKSYVPEPDMNASMEQYGNNYYAPKRIIKTKLRPIYIDGSNVAFGYTQGRYFSVTGLKICIDYFLKRGHEVHAFVPHFRKNQCSNPLLFEELIKNGLIITTPSRYLNGKNLTPYDDRYIVKCAAVNRGVIVSCDNYRDLIKENAQLQPVIEKRLLMPMWVNGMLMFPDDPLGRHGPTLEDFLRF